MAKATPWTAWPRATAIANLRCGLSWRLRRGFGPDAGDDFRGIDGAGLTRSLVGIQQHDLGIGFVIGAHHHIHRWIVRPPPPAPITKTAATPPAATKIRIGRAIGDRLD